MEKKFFYSLMTFILMVLLIIIGGVSKYTAEAYRYASGQANTFQPFRTAHDTSNLPNQSLNHTRDWKSSQEVSFTYKTKPKVKTKKSTINRENVFADGKYVALTFDDGPTPHITPQILEILDDFNVKATFFMLGVQIDLYPKEVKRVAALGHEIGNHTEEHLNLTKLTLPEIRQQIDQTSEKIEEITGKKPNVIRPPYGIWNDAVQQVAKENRTPMVMWSVDTLDWREDARYVKQVVKEEAQSGSVILMHDTEKATVGALPDILTELKEKGYQFVTVSQLLALQGKEDKPVFHRNRY